MNPEITVASFLMHCQHQYCRRCPSCFCFYDFECISRETLALIYLLENLFWLLFFIIKVHILFLHDVKYLPFQFSVFELSFLVYLQYINETNLFKKLWASCSSSAALPK